MDDYDQKLIFLKAFALLLILALPPLAIWSGKIVRSLKGWKLIGLPVIIYITVAYVIFTSGVAQVTLTVAYKWLGDPADLVGHAVWMFGLVCFLYGGFAPDAKPAQNPPNG